MAEFKYKELINAGAEITRKGTITDGNIEFPEYLTLARESGFTFFKYYANGLYGLHFIQIDDKAFHELDREFQPFEEINSLDEILERISKDTRAT
ncbi:hypothetical protein AUJ84_04680 [Candidatus Pacearchaeota archaeon CG1_02_32_132]|nr:MAG: hypothetical protein AUJ84_04680 [Candidatus Pacearchaeota archaeon CG1_02_32_132]